MGGYVMDMFFIIITVIIIVLSIFDMIRVIKRRKGVVSTAFLLSSLILTNIATCYLHSVPSIIVFIISLICIICSFFAFRKKI